tara:strand:- start:91 stop:234 length:144 start_codon:yes stop_codon:yes gene_type:complete
LLSPVNTAPPQALLPTATVLLGVVAISPAEAPINTFSIPVVTAFPEL